MTATVSPTADQVDGALRSFLLSVLPSGVEVIRGQANRVPAPRVPNYVVFTDMRNPRLATNVDTWDESAPAIEMRYEQETDAVYQVDVYGPASADNARIVTTLFRDEFAASFFRDNGGFASPLYADDPRQLPFRDENQQIETRWVFEAHLQVDAVVTIEQPFADSGKVGVINVDAEYPG